VPRRSGFAYQPALDGVRALAVAMVLVFHAGFGWLSGGDADHATKDRRPDGLHYSDEAATEIADDFLAPLLIDAAVS
jgi:peptidoglycan/LPS O-acetylase OafA/YrhL